MAMTLLQMRTAIKAHGLGSREDITDATVDLYINLSQERLARVHDWRELRQTTDITLNFTSTPASDKILDLAAKLGNTFRALYNIVIEDSAESIRLEAIPYSQFDNLIPLPEQTSTGRPSIYTLYNKTEAILHKVPDKAYTARIRWQKWPALLTGDPSTSDLDRKDDVLIHLTLSFALSLYRVEESLTHFAIYQTILKESIGEDSRNPEVIVIRPNFLLGSMTKPLAEYWRDPFFRG